MRPLDSGAPSGKTSKKTSLNYQWVTFEAHDLIFWIVFRIFEALEEVEGLKVHSYTHIYHHISISIYILRKYEIPCILYVFHHISTLSAAISRPAAIHCGHIFLLQGVCGIGGVGTFGPGKQGVSKFGLLKMFLTGSSTFFLPVLMFFPNSLKGLGFFQ